MEFARLKPEEMKIVYMHNNFLRYIAKHHLELVHCCPLGWIKVHRLTEKSLGVQVDVGEALVVSKRQNLCRVVFVEASSHLSQICAPLVMVNMFQESFWR